jgi:hypothetical protein
MLLRSVSRTQMSAIGPPPSSTRWARSGQALNSPWTLRRSEARLTKCCERYQTRRPSGP